MQRMSKEYSLCVSVQKLRQLKANKNIVVSHPCSSRWENFYKKSPKRVRFFDPYFGSGVFIVKAIKKQIQMGETIIKIEIEKEL